MSAFLASYVVGGSLMAAGLLLAIVAPVDRATVCDRISTALALIGVALALGPLALNVVWQVAS